MPAISVPFFPGLLKIAVFGVRRRAYRSNSVGASVSRVAGAVAAFATLISLAPAAEDHIPASMVREQACLAAATDVKSAWSDAERWVWGRTCAGATADFSGPDGRGDRLDPTDEAAWREHRRSRAISSDFLERVLSDPALRDKIPRQGLRIANALFPGVVNLSDLNIERVVWFDRSRFEDDVSLRRSEISRLLSLDGSYISGGLYLNITRTGPILARSATIGTLHILESHVDGTIDLQGSTIAKKLYIDRSTFARSLLIRSGDLSGVKKTSIIFCTISSNLELSGTTLGSTDLTGTTVRGELRLVGKDDPPASWRPQATLTLLNARIGTLHDHEDSWPEGIELGGLSVEHWGGYDDRGENDNRTWVRKGFDKRNSAWFRAWLDKDHTTERGSYQLLVRLLRDAGRNSVARDLLYVAREKDRTETRDFSWVLLTISKFTVGHGYHVELAFLWFALLVVLAYPVFWSGTTAPSSNRPRSWFVFTLDSIIPLIELDKVHAEVRFVGWRQNFLYFMRVMSAVLAFFVLRYIGSILDQ